jgi:hypothetical protein
VAERSKASVCGRSLVGIACSNLAGGMDVCLLCVVSEDKGRSQDKQDDETSTNKVQKEKKRRTINTRT